MNSTCMLSITKGGFYKKAPSDNDYEKESGKGIRSVSERISKHFERDYLTSFAEVVAVFWTWTMEDGCS